MYIVPNRNRNTRLTSTPRLEKKKKKKTQTKQFGGSVAFPTLNSLSLSYVICGVLCSYVHVIMIYSTT